MKNNESLDELLDTIEILSNTIDPLVRANAKDAIEIIVKKIVEIVNEIKR